MIVKIRFFAALRDIVGDFHEKSYPEGTSIQDIWHDFERLHPKLSEYRPHIFTARNHEYTNPSQGVVEGDEVAFIPPVSGG